MITKKKCVIGLAIFILNSSTLAEDRTGFYLKGDVGVNKIKNAKQYFTDDDTPNIKFGSKSKISPAFNIAAGFYLNNFVRHDLSFLYQKVNFKKSSINHPIYNEEEDINYMGLFEINRKSSIYSVMFNSYIDLPISDKFNFIFGGGIGIAQIKEKLKGKIVIKLNDGVNVTANDQADKSVNRRNFAYSLTTGISLKVSDNTNFEFTYNWQDFGKTKYKDKDVTKNRYNGHSVMTGIRFNI